MIAFIHPRSVLVLPLAMTLLSLRPCVAQAAAGEPLEIIIRSDRIAAPLASRAGFSTSMPGAPSMKVWR